MKAWYNGEFVDWNSVQVSPLSHGFSRGTSIFEVVDIVSNNKGTACLGLDQHIKRFFKSAKALMMELPFTPDRIFEAVLETVKANRISSGMAKFYAYFDGVELRSIPETTEVTIAIFVFRMEEIAADIEQYTAPINVAVSSYRKNHPESSQLHAKITGNYVNAYLAAMEVRNRGYQDAILVDTAGFVAEGPTANIFFVKNRQVFTPIQRSILPGVMRSLAIETLKSMNYQVIEIDIKPEDLYSIEEAFYTSSVRRIKPIRSIEGRKIGQNCPGPVTSVLINRIQDIVDGKLSLSEKFLAYV